jgi:hypothetical protein
MMAPTQVNNIEYNSAHEKSTWRSLLLSSMGVHNNIVFLKQLSVAIAKPTWEPFSPLTQGLTDHMSVQVHLQVVLPPHTLHG